MTPKRRTIVESGESEYAIGKATGVSQSVLSRFVRSERGISLETAAVLCDHLNLALTLQTGRQ